MKLSAKLGKEDRISKHDEIARVFNLGKRASDGIIRLYMLANNLGRSRVAIVISRRHGKAVNRNRIKRRCREAFRTCRDDLPGSYDYVINPRVGVDLSVDAIRQSLRDLATRAMTKQESK